MYRRRASGVTLTAPGAAPDATTRGPIREHPDPAGHRRHVRRRREHALDREPGRHVRAGARAF